MNALVTLSSEPSWQELEEFFQDNIESFEGWKPGQDAAMNLWMHSEFGTRQRLLLHFPTGEGKTITSLALLRLRGWMKVVVLAPPITHKSWQDRATLLGMELVLMSVAKFRQKATKLPRDTPVIVDEVHELGGHGKDGIKKMARMAPHIPAIILMSATPHYNSPERAYCIGIVLDPLNNRGGFIPWIYRNCLTTPNPFASTPYIDGFLEYDSAADWLLAQGYTAYVEDTAEWVSNELHFESNWDDELFELYNLDESQMRIMASIMERNHRNSFLQRVDPKMGELRPDVLEQLVGLLDTQHYLIFCAHSEIAHAVARSIDSFAQVYLITGETSTGLKQDQVRGFVQSKYRLPVMVGTSAMATGLDGLDTVCDSLIIFDDLVGDGAKRRQLIGRVLPRNGQERETFVTTIRVNGD